jgi:hypothetical protein
MAKRARSQDDDRSELLLRDPATHRVVRLRARLIVNRALEMAERIADESADVPAEDRRGCITKLAKMYAVAIGFTLKQAARMTLIEALEVTSARTRITTEAEARAKVEHIYFGSESAPPDAALSRARLVDMIEDDRLGGRRDVQEVVHYVERSFPDRATLSDGTMPLYQHRALVVDALAAVRRTAGRMAGEAKTGESKKWKPVANLIDAIGFGPVKPSVLPVEWSRWNRAADASAEAIQGRRRGRPRKN